MKQNKMLVHNQDLVLSEKYSEVIITCLLLKISNAKVEILYKKNEKKYRKRLLISACLSHAYTSLVYELHASQKHAFTVNKTFKFQFDTSSNRQGMKTSEYLYGSTMPRLYNNILFSFISKMRVLFLGALNVIY